MNTGKYLSQVKNLDTIPQLINKIKSIFENYDDTDYIPAIIEEGNYTINDGEDLYIKLVLKHQSIKLNKTWLKDNFAFGLEEPTNFDDTFNNDAFIHNVIINRNYKSRNLYQLNPLLVSDEINEYEYTNSNIINAYFNDEYSNIKGLPVLKDSSSEKLLILRKALKLYINGPKNNYYPKFELVAEFEYRSHLNHLREINSNIFESNDAYVKVDRTDKATFVLGSIIITLDNTKTIKNRSVRVIDLKNLKPREHNFSHYNGDTIEGFICFKLEVINVLNNNYYFYDLQMIDKNNTQNSYLIDVLSDKVVFWEAEYNKLPSYIKDKIDPYNYVPKKTKGIISEAMSAMQLETDWNWDKKLPPEYKLANLIRDRAFNRAIDMGLSFILPKTVENLKEFILKIEVITNVKLDKFNSNANDVRKLIDIRNGTKLKIDSEDIKLLYKKYCHAIQMEFKK